MGVPARDGVHCTAQRKVECGLVRSTHCAQDTIWRIAAYLESRWQAHAKSLMYATVTSRAAGARGLLPVRDVRSILLELEKWNVVHGCMALGLLGVRCMCMQPVREVRSIVDELDKWIDEYPPVQQPMRFGNKAFRTWHERLSKASARPPAMPEYRANNVQHAACNMQRATSRATCSMDMQHATYSKHHS
jgi:hypothetical protein